MSPVFKVVQRSIHVNNILVLKCTDDILVVHVDFNQRKPELDSAGVSDDAHVFYLGDEDCEAPTSIEISGFTKCEADEKIRSAVQMGRYSAVIFMAKLSNHETKTTNFTEVKG